MTAHSIREAWEMAHEIFTTDYEKDEFRSKRAGYNVYFSTDENVYAWICDLGDRLELNLENGKTVNIWIDVRIPFTYKEYAKITKELYR